MQMSVWLPVVVSALSFLVGAFGLLISYRSTREKQLRLDDVLKWSNEVIRAMQTLYLICLLGEKNLEAGEAKAMRQRIAIDTSVLVEQGRMFFKNQPDPAHGKDKPPAYRGYRAEILDPIVVAHQIACRWDAADAEARQRMTLVAEGIVRRFVSMAQQEVGRGETQSREMAKGGRGDSLETLMQAFDAARLDALGGKERRGDDGA
jgi:hypothetical protein